MFFPARSHDRTAPHTGHTTLHSFFFRLTRLINKASGRIVPPLHLTEEATFFRVFSAFTPTEKSTDRVRAVLWLFGL